MKKESILLSVFMSLIFVLTLIYAANFSDISQSDFNLGNYSNTSYNGVGVMLNGSNLSGVYLSRVFDATSAARWNNSTFVYQSPYLDVVFGIDISAEVWQSSDSGYNWAMINSDYTGSDGNGLVEMSVNSSGSFFATYNQQLYKSDNFGISWVKTSTDINGAGDSNAMVAMAIDNLDNIFIIDNSEDVLKSTDSGATFVKVNNTDFNGANGAIFGMVSSSSGILFAVDVQSDVWESTNLGVSWQLTKDDYNGAAGNGGNDLIINSTGALFIIDGQDIWQSTDSGVAWTKINDDFNMGSDTNNGITGAIDKNNTFYIADGSEDIYKSIDSGITFTRTIQNLNGAPGNILGLIAFRKNTNLTFQIRNCSLSDCSDSVWQTMDLNNINLTGRYFQYKADFSSQDNSLSPKLYNVSLDYTILDNTPPEFLNYAENPANNSAYSYEGVYGFNVTITDNSAVGGVWIEFNGVNYTLGISNISNVYTFIKNNLAAGIYSYKWWANDSYGNLNSSELNYYTISKANPLGNMLIAGTSPIIYGTFSDFIETETNLGDGGVFIL
jgi:photosystem II stability/assembly factor-like uncharacterized protein